MVRRREKVGIQKLVSARKGTSVSRLEGNEDRIDMLKYARIVHPQNPAVRAKVIQTEKSQALGVAFIRLPISPGLKGCRLPVASIA